MKINDMSKYITLCLLTIILTSCSLFGLELQEDYKYDDTSFNPKVDKTVLEFIKSNPAQFSSMLEAIRWADMEEEYNKTGRTYLVLTNRALMDEEYLPTNSKLPLGSYFACNRVPNANFDALDASKGPKTIIPDNWNAYHKEIVRAFLKYHIMLGLNSWESAPKTQEWFRTAAYVEGLGDSCLVCFSVRYDRSTPMNFNNYSATINNASFSNGPRKGTTVPKLSGIECTNGIVHVLDDYLLPPYMAIVRSNNFKIN